MTVEEIEHLVDDVPDSKKTQSRNILFFYENTTVKEALKKLKNHKFKLGYTYDIDVDGEKYVRIVCYNFKNDIFGGWFKYDVNSGELVFPDNLYAFPSLLTAVRYMPGDDNSKGKLKKFREDCHQSVVKSFSDTGKFSNLDYVEEVNNLDYYGNYFPVLENPMIEQYRRNSILHSANDRTFYSDVAYVCNIYKFRETYDLLDDGLKQIYFKLFENYEELFCAELFKMGRDFVPEVTSVLNISVSELGEMFERNNFISFNQEEVITSRRYDSKTLKYRVLNFFNKK